MPITIEKFCFQRLKKKKYITTNSNVLGHCFLILKIYYRLLSKKLLKILKARKKSNV